MLTGHLSSDFPGARLHVGENQAGCNLGCFSFLFLFHLRTVSVRVCVCLAQTESLHQFLLRTTFCLLSVVFSSLSKVLFLAFSTAVLTPLRAVHGPGTFDPDHPPGGHRTWVEFSTDLFGRSAGRKGQRPLSSSWGLFLSYLSMLEFSLGSW